MKQWYRMYGIVIMKDNRTENDIKFVRKIHIIIEYVYVYKSFMYLYEIYSEYMINI